MDVDVELSLKFEDCASASARTQWFKKVIETLETTRDEVVFHDYYQLLNHAIYELSNSSTDYSNSRQEMTEILTSVINLICSMLMQKPELSVVTLKQCLTYWRKPSPDQTKNIREIIIKLLDNSTIKDDCLRNLSECLSLFSLCLSEDENERFQNEIIGSIVFLFKLIFTSVVPERTDILGMFTYCPQLKLRKVKTKDSNDSTHAAQQICVLLNFLPKLIKLHNDRTKAVICTKAWSTLLFEFLIVCREYQSGRNNRFETLFVIEKRTWVALTSLLNTSQKLSFDLLLGNKIFSLCDSVLSQQCSEFVDRICFNKPRSYNLKRFAYRFCHMCICNLMGMEMRLDFFTFITDFCIKEINRFDVVRREPSLNEKDDRVLKRASVNNDEDSKVVTHCLSILRGGFSLLAEMGVGSSLLSDRSYELLYRNSLFCVMKLSSKLRPMSVIDLDNNRADLLMHTCLTLTSICQNPHPEVLNNVTYIVNFLSEAVPYVEFEEAAILNRCLKDIKCSVHVHSGPLLGD